MDVDVVNRQHQLPLAEDQLAQAVRLVVQQEGARSGTVSLAVVDDTEMQALNRQYLQHDWPTDVLSFAFRWDGSHLEGEIILGAETAVRAAREHGGDAADELLWYAIHGALHLVGYDDQTPADRQRMRAAERIYLQALGRVLPGVEDPPAEPRAVPTRPRHRISTDAELA